MQSEKDHSPSSKVFVDESCTYRSKPISLQSWKENDYQLVVDTKKTIIDECVKKINLAYDKFLPLPNMNKN